MPYREGSAAVSAAPVGVSPTGTGQASTVRGTGKVARFVPAGETPAEARETRALPQPIRECAYSTSPRLNTVTFTRDDGPAIGVHENRISLGPTARPGSGPPLSGTFPKGSPSRP